MTGKRNSAEQIANKQSKTRLKWTEAMKTKLLECKREAMDFVQSKDPPRKADGKKQGYMAIMKQLWDNSEFAELNISTQNLRDRAARIEKSLGSALPAQQFVRNRIQQLIYYNLTWTIKKRVAKIWNSIIMNSTTTQIHQEICILRTRKSQRKMKRLLK